MIFSKTLLVLLAVPMSLLAQAAEPANLVANGDFSQARDGKPENWSASGNETDVTQTLSAEKDADGSRSPGSSALAANAVAATAMRC